MQSADSGIFNALTIDVEDYYMVSAFAHMVKFENWRSYESRVEMNTHRILDLLDEHKVKGTFFVLGWVAENCPALPREIMARGHELASHGYNHRLIYNMTPDQFREDVRLSKKILEDCTGQSVSGYRAASYSIVEESLWALDVLIEEGFRYDSSIFPIHHDRYGMPNSPRFPHIIRTATGQIWEFPPSTFRVFGQNIPVAGGGYLRLLPHYITRTAIKRINDGEKNLAVVYFHPWEIDPGQPKMKVHWKSRFRHYVNLESTLSKIGRILAEFKFKPLRNILEASFE